MAPHGAAPVVSFCDSVHGGVGMMLRSGRFQKLDVRPAGFFRRQAQSLDPKPSAKLSQAR